MITGQPPADYDEAVDMLARQHRQESPRIQAIYVFPDPDRKEIRFIEVNPDTIPTDEAMVFGFAPAGGFPFRTAVGEVTPQEWDRIRRGEIPLPEGWDPRQARLVEVNGA